MDQRSMNRSGSGGDIVGITLSVDECGPQPAQSLKFWKSTARVIEIGRRSAQAKGDGEDGNHALFRCPVISRRHAKITFSEYGNVYITDLKSHHGTYILRPGETASRLIAPELPNVLADGDLLTFGKAVGKDQDLVSPITAKVTLQFGSDVGPISVAATASHETSSPKSGSGRYGVFMPLSDASSESDSDVEEIPPPYTPSLQTHGFEFSARINDLVREASSAFRPDMLRRHVLPPFSVFLNPSPEPPAVSHSIQGQDASFDADSTEGSPEVVEVRSPVESNRVALENDFPEFIGAWPKSPEDSVIPSPSHTPLPEDNAVTHVSSEEGVSHQTEEEATGLCMPDSTEDDLFYTEKAHTANVWARLTPEVETSVSPATEHTPRAPIEEASEAIAEKDKTYQAAPEEDKPKESEQQQELQPLSQKSVVHEQMSHADAASHESLAIKAFVSHEEDVSTMRGLKQAMEEMYAKAQKEIESELYALRTARAEAEAAAIQLRAQRAVLAASIIAPAGVIAASLKRKRKAAEDEDVDVKLAAGTSSHNMVPVGTDARAPVAPVSKRRRTLEAMSAVAQTAAVATFGAVAAWTALAYS